MTKKLVKTMRDSKGRFASREANCTHKKCPVCKEVKEIADFPKNGNRYKYAYCKVCHNVKQRGDKLKREYGITLEQYADMVTKQDGTCWICKRPPKKIRLAVDHNHKTGKVRGLLCWMCNRVLGMWREDKDRFKRAHQYLNKFNK